ncbi:hypothetical protein [Aliterella atlantica]|uniref:Beta/gamma crystallin 'Greek key' domain-containing protein n=1 Tax=Aliterella atlantica CENA595 TaxID=1618023 RepID=A0A0D8ZSN4_9CYAN|nr:hypothetical protein [Aliterella atlantica]KJH70226.1 hypothetical protein UH38_18890 [Aliterella atlantica CENA595]
MKNHRLTKNTSFLKLISLSILLACSFSLIKTEAASAECGGIYQQEIQKGSIDGKPANVRIASWAHGSCEDFKTREGVFKFRSMLEWKDNCQGTSYAECGVLQHYLNERRIKILGNFDGSRSYGWKFKDSKGRIRRAIIYK